MLLKFTLQTPTKGGDCIHINPAYVATVHETEERTADHKQWVESAVIHMATGANFTVADRGRKVVNQIRAAMRGSADG